MTRWLPLLVSASAWVLVTMLLGDLLLVWESPASLRWHAAVPYTGLVVVCVVFWPRRLVR